MSVTMMAKVWQLDLDPTPKLVLLKLADYVNQDGTTAWPSVERIAYECCIDRRTAQRTLRKLEDARLVVARAPAGRHSAVVYELHPDRGVKLPPLLLWSGAASDPSKGRQIVQPGAASDPVRGGTAPPEPEENQNNRTGRKTESPPNPPKGGSAERARNGSRRTRDVVALERLAKDYEGSLQRARKR